MKKNNCYHLLPLLAWLALTLISVTVLVESRDTHPNEGPSHCQHRKHGGYHGDDELSCSIPKQPRGGDFSVISFGAKGDGKSDDSKALLKAWRAACKAPLTQANVNIPQGFSFLIRPITLQGPCSPQLTLQIDGSLLAPPRVSSWPRSGLLQWINLKWVNNFSIRGSGIVDGQGHEWWSSTDALINPLHRKSKHVPNIKPTAIRFYDSYNVIVRDITIVNSPLCHLKFNDCRGITVDNITISSPKDSDNTDGIHLQNSREVVIKHSTIASGDDCVSIQTGCSNVYIHHLDCGPGHGISLGGLGKDKTVACVSDITVEDITMTSTLYGARIKTWQGGQGLVKNVTFININVTEVKVPIMIDQYYCDKTHCKNQTEAVAISSVTFNHVMGTYQSQAVHLACSQSVPCVGVDLIDIQLKASTENGVGSLEEAVCSNSYGKAKGALLPLSVSECLRSGNGVLKGVEKSHERECHRQFGM